MSFRDITASSGNCSRFGLPLLQQTLHPGLDASSIYSIGIRAVLPQVHVDYDGQERVIAHAI